VRRDQTMIPIRSPFVQAAPRC